jgi:hypothetical protein
MGRFNAVFLGLQTKSPDEAQSYPAAGFPPLNRNTLWRHSFAASWPAINQPGRPSIIPTAKPVNGTETQKKP